MQATKAADRLAAGQNILQFGMQFLLNSDHMKAGLNDEIVRDVFFALCKIHYYEHQEMMQLPDDGEEISEE